MRIKLMGSLIAATAILTTSSFAADAKKPEKDGLSFKIHDNLRYEGVEQANTKKDATALTNRFLIGTKYKSGAFSAYAELINISAVDDSYSDGITGNGNDSDYSLVLDPEQTRITQAKLMYNTKAFDITLGRDMYTLDDHRFVGHVFWRQMPQTFDLAGFTYKGVEGLKVKAAYVYGRHQVGYYNNLWGTHSYGGAYNYATKTNSILINANYKVNKDLTVVAYNYQIAENANTQGIDTIGGYVKGSAGDFGYKLEYAEQGKGSRKTDDQTAVGQINDSEYSNIELSYKVKGVKLIAAQETMGGDGTTAFQTPWATLHKFNGWTDQFIAGGTPAGGLVDTSVAAVYKKKGLGKFLVRHHTFDSDSGTYDYGSELELLHTGKISAVKGMSYLLKYSDFSADAAWTAANSAKVDTTKMWASLSYTFKSK